MKSFTLMTLVIIVIFILCMDALCFGEAESDVTPMVNTEQEALYSAIQGFVGNGWNGSDLYPDPCGWTPIQVLHSSHFFLSFNPYNPTTIQKIKFHFFSL